MKKLLFLSFYYKHDLCAGSFRATPLVNELARRCGGAWEIHVLTTMPNRYSSFSAQAPSVESNPGVKVFRFRLPPHRSGMADQAVAFFRYARMVVQTVRNNSYEGVFATSSRLATGVLGAWVARRSHLPYYLDIRDIFSDTLDDLFRGSPKRALLPFVRLAETFALKTASHTNLVSGGFVPYFREKGLIGNFSLYPNGIDDEFVGRDFSKTQVDGRKTLLYAGNIGEGQGLHRIVPGLALRMGVNWVLRIVGDGGKRSELEREIAERNIPNVEILNPVPRGQLLDMYREADVLFIHLNDHDAFKRVLPSKIFEYAATGKPILAGVGGYAAEFLKKNVSNVSLFAPCDHPSALEALQALKLDYTDRRIFVQKYSRKKITELLAEDILRVMNCPGR